jgi:hypothetical protein
MGLSSTYNLSCFRQQILEDEGLEVSHLFSLEEKPPRCKEYVEEKGVCY